MYPVRPWKGWRVDGPIQAGELTSSTSIANGRGWERRQCAQPAPGLFNRLFRPTADYALDFQTGTTGMDVTAFHLARMELPEVRAMAELFPIDQIFDNAAYPTLLANAFIDVGIPAFTPEIGARASWTI